MVSLFEDLHKKITACFAVRDSGSVIDADRAMTPGLGLVCEHTKTGQLIVHKLLDGSPSQKSGKIQPGDIVISIDDQNINKLSVREVKARLDGENGTEVTVGFCRPDVDHLIRVTMKRGYCAPLEPGVSAPPVAPAPQQQQQQSQPTVESTAGVQLHSMNLNPLQWLSTSGVKPS